MKKVILIFFIVLTSCSEISDQIFENIEEKREEKTSPHVDYLFYNSTEYNFNAAYIHMYGEVIDLGYFPSKSYSPVYSNYYILNSAEAVMYYKEKKFSYVLPSLVTPDTIRDDGIYVYKISIDNLSKRTLKVDLSKL